MQLKKLLESPGENQISLFDRAGTHFDQFHFFVRSAKQYRVQESLIRPEPFASLVDQVHLGLKWIHSQKTQANAKLKNGRRKKKISTLNFGEFYLRRAQSDNTQAAQTRDVPQDHNDNICK